MNKSIIIFMIQKMWYNVWQSCVLNSKHVKLLVFLAPQVTLTAVQVTVMERVLVQRVPLILREKGMEKKQRRKKTELVWF